MRKISRSSRAGWFMLSLVVFGLSYAASPTERVKSGKQPAASTPAQARHVIRPEWDIHHLRQFQRDDLAPPRSFDNSIMAPRPLPQSTTSTLQSLTPPPPSPGLAIGVTSYDKQHNESSGHQTARMPDADIVHFVWTAWDHIPRDLNEADRHVAYNSYTISTSTLNQGTSGSAITGSSARAGYTNGDVFDDNTFHAVLHLKSPDLSSPYIPWHVAFPIPGSDSAVFESLSNAATLACSEVLWPKIACSRDGARTIHVAAIENTNDCPRGLIYYWRNTGGMWTGPGVIDSSDVVGYVLADDPTSGKVAIAFHVTNSTDLLDVAYHESNTDGYGWLVDDADPGNLPEELELPRTVITNYSDPDGPQSWVHISTGYTSSGDLQILYDEQRYANLTAEVAIRHWSKGRGTVRTAYEAYWPSPMSSGNFNLNVSNMTMGFGDGGTLCDNGVSLEPNLNYVYVVFAQFAGPSLEEQADASAGGLYNGELYLSVSNNDGVTWADPINLSNTKTPNCNPGLADTAGNPQFPDNVCRSESYPTIGLAVHDIDIFFISDLDAGAISASEGTWQMNPVHYLRLPGGTDSAEYVCPVLVPTFNADLTEDPECEYHATQPETATATLTVANLGNGDLMGAIAVTDFPGDPSLVVAEEGSYTIGPGGVDLVSSVVMSANGAPEGLYSGLISITHNDLSIPSPQDFPIQFFVVNDFHCPQDELLKTGVAVGLSSLQLEVTNSGRFAAQQSKGQLWRYADSSSSIFDGSLLIAHGEQAPDTTVFMRFSNRASNGQYGFRSLGNLMVDTSAYGTDSGWSTATAHMCTRDSVVGVKVEWLFPQNPALDEFVVARYQIYRHKPSVPITDLAIGILTEFDVLPASRLGTIQSGVHNVPGLDSSRHLVWQQGTDTMGHFPIGQNTATRFRAGIAVPGGFAGARIGSSEIDLISLDGPDDGFLYQSLATTSGIQIYYSITDLYTFIALDRNRTIGVGETLTYTAIFVSDTIDEASLKSTVDAATAAVGCACPCKHDPACDGVVSDAVDVVSVIDAAFRGEVIVTDPNCPVSRSDVDASGTTDIQDVIKVINVAFRGQLSATTYVDPCL